MLSLDWKLIADWILRYYLQALILLPLMMGICFLDKRLASKDRKTAVVLCLMLVLLILLDVANQLLSKQTYFSVWRLIFSVLGFCLRPVCLLVVLLDLVPENGRNAKIRFLLSLPAIINMLVFCSAFISPLAISFDAGNNYFRGPLFNVAFVVSALYMLLLAGFALANVQRRKRRKGIAVLLLVAASFVASVLESNGIAYPAPLLNQAIATSITLYFLLQFMSTSSDVIENMQLSLLLMQIKPHFINNSLAAIRSLIRIDREKAVDALDHFSGYLRDSMLSIRRTDLIPLSQEIDLIDNYLYLENARFRDSITVIKELAPMDFFVPPLTIQPLVENAVRHGLRGIRTQGRLTIRTEIDSREYRIIVTDNGRGYDMSQPLDPKCKHVGIENVRMRLELMCGGTLSIQSTPGVGTTSVVHIPAKMLPVMKSNISY